LQIAKAKRKAGITTENRRFAECLRRSAKPIMYSAKALRSAALDKAHTAKKVSVKTALPSAFYRALGKAFAECLTLGHSVRFKTKKSQKK
jgi:hypothetical protein